jgi:predicted alpha/beta superfamily hydrolase
MLRRFTLLVPLLAACSSSLSSPATGDGGTAWGGSGSGAGAQGDAGAGSGSSSGGGAGDSGAPALQDGGAPDAPSGLPVTTIRVHYPAGSHTLSLRGSAAPLSWSTGVPLTAGANGTFTLSTTAASGAFELKPLLDDTTWSLGPNYKATAGATVDVYPRFTQVDGSYVRAYDFASTVLGNSRGIWIYQPPTYIENTLAPMPVVYMHDGQNLFDPSAAFGGNTWQADGAMNTGANDGSIAEALLVGIENTADRIPEYTPVPDPTNSPPGGDGDAYLTMIVTELKPKIDHDMRTIPDAAHTFMIGSSLGGLITAYAGVTHADVFGGVGALSPSTWWDGTWVIGEVGKTPASPRPLRVYVDSGDSGPSNDDVTNTANLAKAYQALGYAQGTTLDYRVQAGGQHSEIYWAQRLPGTLAFLLGPGR